MMKYDRMVAQSYETLSTAAALLKLARIKGSLSQAKLAERAGVPTSMISAYERDLRQPTIPTLVRLLEAAGFELRLHLERSDRHDSVLAERESKRSKEERRRRDAEQDAWRDAVDLGPAEGG